MVALAMPQRMRAKSGDRCPEPGCSGKIVVYSTIVNARAAIRVRYHECDVCGCKPPQNKQIVPLNYAPARRFSG